ncbi:MAG TPA: pitrilysin family protein [Longimicrobium sp.]|uniref:M16 family metallopeptidase n=1 Tax=Longimicrobium sp. TaxID=2029185 RepID=UPI002ED7E95B
MSTSISSSIRIPSTTRVLGNGLRVVAHEDRGAPIVTVHLMFRAGSRDERPGRTGLAHLLEHLFFEGSQHAPKGHFDDVLERVGGTNNGTTWLDRTNYYETVPTHAVEVPLWLERDRLGFFLPVLTGEILELQRGVVMNERRQVYENRPYGMADERLHELLFPGAHPYSWPTIGYMRDLEAITLDDAREFYQTYYTPGNAVLVFAGDIAPERAFELAEKYLGDLPAGPAIQPAAAPDLPASPGGVREVMEDEVSFPRVHQAFSVPGYGSPDWIALDVLAYLLADGDSSRLQRALVRDGRLAQDIDSYLYPTALCGVFGIVGTARSEIEPEALEAAVRQVLDDVIRDGVTEAEVTGAIRRVRRDQVSELATMEERADTLAYAATVLGDADRIHEVLDGYAKVTADDLQRVAAAYLSADRAATLVVVPADEEGDEDEEVRDAA